MQVNSSMVSEKPSKPQVQAGKLDLPTPDEQHVRDRLAEAGVTLVCIRDWRRVPAEMTMKWKPIALGMLELGRLWQRAASFPTPDGDRVERMVEVIRWLDELRDDQQRIVAGMVIMAPGSTTPIMPIRILAAGMRTDAKAIHRRFDQAVATIAASKPV
jgi:hypothetical protein